MIDFLTTLGAIIGTVTGIAGTVIGYLAYQKSNNAALLDLRIEHADIFTTIQVELDDLRELSQKADQSRIYRLNAQGMFHSGPMQKWRDQQDASIKKINALSLEFRSYKASQGKETFEHLEADIRSMMLIEKRIKSLIEGYKEAITEDDVARDHLVKMQAGFQSTRG